LLAHDQDHVLPLGDLELPALDAGKRLERRAGRRAAARAVTVRRVAERIRDLIANRATLALPDEKAVVPFALASHGLNGTG
jgi:hypothetical protein